MTDEPILEIAKSHRALSELLDEVERLKAEVGSYSRAAGALEPAAAAVTATAARLTETIAQFQAYGDAVGKSDVSGLTAEVTQLSTNMSEARNALVETQRLTVEATGAVNALTANAVTQEFVSQKLAALQSVVEEQQSMLLRVNQTVLDSRKVLDSAIASLERRVADTGESLREHVSKSATGLDKQQATRFEQLDEVVTSMKSTSASILTVSIISLLAAAAAALFAYLGMKQ